MTSDEFIKSYWNYYLQLEQQVLDTQRYVDFNAQNNAAYSIEYLQLFLSICSEIDVLAKVIAMDHNPAFKGENINAWGIEVDEALPGIQTTRVTFNDDYCVTPWDRWYHERTVTRAGNPSSKLTTGSKNPDWWTKYNKVKHQRTSVCAPGRLYYSQANLKNVVLSLAALRVLETTFLELLFAREGIEAEYNKGNLMR